MLLELDLKRCSRCSKKFTDLIAAVTMELEVFRLSETGVPEGIPNLKQAPREYLCKECFDKFADVMSQLNMKYQEVAFLEEQAQEIPPDETAGWSNECGCNPIKEEITFHKENIVDDVKYDEE